MSFIVEAVLRRISDHLHKRNINSALALHRRGEVRTDGLKPLCVCTQMEIEWRAREIHPWDRDRPVAVQNELFVQQSLADTEAAINRLFQRIPQLDVIKLRILAPESDAEIMAGTVYRTDGTDADYSTSVGMRLKSRGVRFHSTGYSLEPLDECCPPTEIERRASPELVSFFRKASWK
jgi:hypothetical protein